MHSLLRLRPRLLCGALSLALDACANASESPADAAALASDAVDAVAATSATDAGRALDASALDETPSDAARFQGDASASDVSPSDGAGPLLANLPCLTSARDECPLPGKDWFVFYFNYSSQPPPERAADQLSLRVVTRRPYVVVREVGSSQNETLFDVVSTPPVDASELLAFVTNPPLAVRSEAIPEQLVYESFGAYGGSCPTQGGELSGVGGRIVRDKSGVLLAATGGLWLRWSGTLQAPGLARMPFGLTWESAESCAPCGPSRWRGAALLLTLPEAAPIRLLPGEQATLRLDGRDYVFRAGWTQQRDRETCGEGSWSLYRADLLTGLYEDGGVYPLP